MADIQEWVEGSKAAWRASDEIAEMVCKSDARILSVERAVETRFRDFVVLFRAVIYSDLHKREAELTVEINNEIMIQPGINAPGHIAAVFLSEFERLEARG